jgi:multidrug efflux pump subunit AcrA (membrane-fusion protein)
MMNAQKIVYLSLGFCFFSSLTTFSAMPTWASNVEDTQDSNIVIAVKSRHVGSRVAIGGTVTPAKSVTLSAQLPGRVKILSGEEGSAFREGNLLAAIDDEDLRAKRQAAEAQWASANATLRNAGMQHSRQLASPSASRGTPGGMGMPGMFDEMFTNPMSSFMGTRDPSYERYADIYSSSTQIEQARNQLIQAQAQIREIDSKLRDAQSVAPFDGLIVRKLVQVGDTVQPGQPLLEYADMREMEIIVDVPARLSKSLQIGQEVPARVDTLDELLNVRIANIFPMADMLRHTIRVKFALPEDTDVAAGIYAEVQLQDPLSADMSLPTIPASAILWRGGLPMVFVVSENKRVNLRMVRVGETMANSEVVILSGLGSHDKVLDKPTPGMVSGHQLP